MDTLERSIQTRPQCRGENTAPELSSRMRSKICGALSRTKPLGRSQPTPPMQPQTTPRAGKTQGQRGRLERRNGVRLVVRGRHRDENNPDLKPGLSAVRATSGQLIQKHHQDMAAAGRRRITRGLEGVRSRFARTEATRSPDTRDPLEPGNPNPGTDAFNSPSDPPRSLGGYKKPNPSAFDFGLPPSA